MSKNVPFKKRGYSPINFDHETELVDTSDEEFDPPHPLSYFTMRTVSIF